MGEGSVVLRQATPDLADGLHFARYLDQAADGFFRIMLGGNVENILASAFRESGHSLSFEHVTFAVQDGSIVGMSSAFSGVQQRSFSDKPLNKAAGRSLFRLKLMHVLFAPVWRILETIDEGDFYLQSLAVDPQRRGAGIGSLLMDDVEVKASDSGFNRLSLDVGAKNLGARKLYIRRGMTELSHWPGGRLLPEILVRMVKQLGIHS